MKKYTILFWVSTGLIVFTQGIVEIAMLGNEAAYAGIAHLGYPAYFFPMLVVFKVLGCIAIAVPQIPGRIKEWAYAGFGIDFIAAFVSHAAVDGLHPILIAPVVFMGILTASYISYHKRRI